MKTFKNLTFPLTAFLLSLLLQTSTAQAAEKPQIVVTFTKWVTTGTHMEGIAGGDIEDVNATFKGEVLSLIQIAGDEIWKIDASYQIIAGDQTFTAIIHGKHSWHTGIGVLNGVIATGWHAGSRVHVEFQAIPDDEHGFVFEGTITIKPN